jgi:hypothetical protein
MAMEDIDAKVNEAEEKREQAAADAYDRIKRGQHWLDWMDIAEGLAVGRNKALRKAGTNDIQNPQYKRAFREWMKDRPWARDLDQPTRAHLFWSFDNRNDVERWRETLAANERLRLNHPTATKRRYEATHRETVNKDAAPQQSKADRMESEIMRLSEEVMTWRKRAETDGSLFDLKKDSVKDIITVVEGNVTSYRFQQLAKGMADRAAEIRKTSKHAG